MTISKRYFILREIATQKTFPTAKQRVRYVEFADDLPPRLFKRRQDALLVARYWCMGHSWIPRSRMQDEYADPFVYDTKPVPGRLLDKLEIVTIELDYFDSERLQT